MWYEKLWQIIKVDVTVTVPGVVATFALGYCLVLAMEAGESGAAWVQAVGSIVAILAAWFIPYRHDLLKQDRQKLADLETLNWVAFRMRNQLEAMPEVLRDPQDQFAFWKEHGGAFSWRVHKEAVDALPTNMLPGDGVTLLLAAREVAARGATIAQAIESEEMPMNIPVPSDHPWFEQIDFLKHHIEFVLDGTKPGWNADFEEAQAEDPGDFELEKVST